MPLLTDDNIVDLQHLRAYESTVFETASTEGIDVTTKLALAHREIGLEISYFLARNGFDSPGDLDRVIVTAAVHQAECMRALELIYKDAYHSQLNDRYNGKWRNYESRSKEAIAFFQELGVGIVSAPLPRPRPAQAEVIGGSSAPGGTYFLAVAWQGLSGRRSGLSTALSIDLPPASVMKVAPGPPPPAATGWHVYVGMHGESLYRQSVDALPLQDSWFSSGQVLRTDLLDLLPQTYDSVVRNRRLLRRG